MIEHENIVCYVPLDSNLSMKCSSILSLCQCQTSAPFLPQIRDKIKVKFAHAKSALVLRIIYDTCYIIFKMKNRENITHESRSRRN